MLQLPNLKYFGKLNKIFKIIKVNRNLKNKTISYLIPMVGLYTGMLLGMEREIYCGEEGQVTSQCSLQFRQF